MNYSTFIVLALVMIAVVLDLFFMKRGKHKSCCSDCEKCARACRKP